LLLSRDGVDPLREHETPTFLQRLCARLLPFYDHSHRSVSRVKAWPNLSERWEGYLQVWYSRISELLFRSGVKALKFSSHSVLSRAEIQQHCQLPDIITPKPLIGWGKVNTYWKAEKVLYRAQKLSCLWCWLLLIRSCPKANSCWFDDCSWTLRMSSPKRHHSLSRK
jgi:hypothetical protein